MSLRIITIQPFEDILKEGTEEQTSPVLLYDYPEHNRGEQVFDLPSKIKYFRVADPDAFLWEVKDSRNKCLKREILFLLDLSEKPFVCD